MVNKMTIQSKPTIFQRTRRVLGRGYELITIQELKIANALQNKIPCGYILTRILGLLFKLALVVFLIFIGSWIIFGILIVFGFFMIDSNKTRERLKTENDMDFGSNQYDYETPGTLEHIAANPDLYDSHGNFK